MTPVHLCELIVSSSRPFNLPSPSVTLFILMVVNNWYIIMVGSVRGGGRGGGERKEGGGNILGFERVVKC